MLLAQHGADVIKVEGIGEGDWARTLGTRYGSHSAYSIIGNLGKKSIAVDLKTEAGKQVLWRLLKGADVFLEGFRPGVIRRLGFDYDAVAAREPRLLYLSISGFGQSGPLAERPAMDPVLQAYTGLMIENRGEDGIPHRVPVIVVDMSTALYAFQALSAALYARRDETRGRYIEVSLMQAATALQSIRLMACHLEGGTMRPGGAPGGVFRIADGWMSMRGHQRPRLAEPVRGDADAGAGRRSALRHAGRCGWPTSDALYAIVRPALAAEPWAVWNKRLTEARLMHERLNSYAEFLDQPHVRETGLIQWLTQAGLNRPVPVPALPGMLRQAEGTPRGTAPVTGQHTADVLAEHGFSAAEIDGPAGARDGRGGMTTAQKKAVVVGALGVIGRYIVDKLLAEGDWQVVGLSRRPARNEPRYSAHLRRPARPQGRRPQAGRPVGHDAHLLCRRAARHRQGGGLRHGGRAQSRHAGEFGQRHRQGRTAPCRRVVLVTGTKYYGVHLGPLKTPMRETDPRHMPPDFYFDQIDWLTDFQRGKKWSFAELRPQTLCGFAPGAAMSIMPAIAVYAAISKELGQPLRFPGKPGAYDTIYQVTEFVALRQCRPVGRDRAALQPTRPTTSPTATISAGATSGPGSPRCSA